MRQLKAGERHSWRTGIAGKQAQLGPARELRGVIEHSGLSFERSKVFKHPQRFSNTYPHLKVVFKRLPPPLFKRVFKRDAQILGSNPFYQAIQAQHSTFRPPKQKMKKIKKTSAKRK